MEDKGYIRILLAKPWLIPFILWLYGRSEFTARDLALGLGVRTPIARRALWWLTKMGIVEKRGGDDRVYFKVTSYGKNFSNWLTLNTIRSKQGILLRYNGGYIVVRIRRTKITCYNVSREIVDRVYSVLAGSPGQEFTVTDISMSTGLRPNTVVKALRVLLILGRATKKDKGYTAR